MLGILAEKVGMTQIFDENGFALPVTVLHVLENVVTQIKTEDSKDGYNAIQVGCVEETKEHRMTKPLIGKFKKKNLSLYKKLKEFRVTSEIIGKYSIGDVIDPAELFEKDSLVDVQGRPIGRGTTGRIKRWNQQRRLMTHGTKHHRQIGSAGPGTTPGRVFPNTKMPGRDSNVVTIPHLKVVSYDPTNRILVVLGSVPGKKNIVTVKPSKPKQGWNKYARDLRKKQEVV